MARVDPRAVVADGARLADDVVVGPFAVVGDGVTVGPGCRIGPHCVLEGGTEVGEGCVLTSHVALGTPPQDLKYGGEPTRLVVGARNVFREFCTVNRGTVAGGGTTRVGEGSLFMTGSHVAHDCQVGSRTVFANNATLGGHVTVEDDVTVGAFCAVHQFCHVGRHAFLGGFTVVTKDALPFMRTVGSRGDVRCYGPNRIGLERKGLAGPAIAALDTAFRRLRSRGGLRPEALAEAVAEAAGAAEVAELLAFVLRARQGRGVHL
jgi:UDP-N-acetylglucosamine acyltransferase